MSSRPPQKELYNDEAVQFLPEADGPGMLLRVSVAPLLYSETLLKVPFKIGSGYLRSAA